MSHIMTTWPSTNEEANRLLQAVARNCTCTGHTAGAEGQLCPAHQMAVADQRAINGLVFARHIVDQLRAEEGLLA